MEQMMAGIKQQLERDLGDRMIQWYELVDWKEPLILGLFGFHIGLLLLVVVAFRMRLLKLQFALFVSLLALIFATERMNSWARNHWQQLASQQYFDQRGVFMGIFYAAPLLGIGFVQLVLNLKQMADMVVIVKRHEFQQQAKAKQKKSQ